MNWKKGILNKKKKNKKRVQLKIRDFASLKFIFFKFYVCVLFKNSEDNPFAYFVFPKGSISVYSQNNQSGMLFIYESDIKREIKKENKLNRHQYMNKWDLIVKPG